MSNREKSTDGGGARPSAGVTHDGRVHLVWKIPKEPIEECEWAEKGVYPSGELMGVFETGEAAFEHEQMLRERSPSERFGDSMEDAPYRFATSVRGVEAANDD